MAPGSIPLTAFTSLLVDRPRVPGRLLAQLLHGQRGDEMMLPMRRSHEDWTHVFIAKLGIRQKRGNGLLSTAGLLNGVFGSGDRLHVAAWKTKKRVIKTEENEDEKITIREREQFVHELAIAFANGETALIE
jgi:hypothetical protein